GQRRRQPGRDAGRRRHDAHPPVTPWDAVVVGAGPAGAATALHLARAGARVILLDRARFPRDKPCSEYLSPETTRLLARLGDGVVAGVIARTGDGKRETCDARVVVGSDGLQSVVARRLGLARRSGPRRVAFSAHVADVAGVRDLGELHVSERGYVGMGPIGG